VHQVGNSCIVIQEQIHNFLLQNSGFLGPPTFETASCTTVSTDRVQKKSQQFIPIKMLCLSFHHLLQNAVVSVTMGHIFWPLLSAFSQAAVHMDMFDCICEISQVKW